MSYGDRQMTEDQDLLFRVRISWGAYVIEREHYDYTQSPAKYLRTEHVPMPAGSSLYGPYTDIKVARRKRTTLSKEYNTLYWNRMAVVVAEIEACQPTWKVVE